MRRPTASIAWRGWWACLLLSTGLPLLAPAAAAAIGPRILEPVRSVPPHLAGRFRDARGFQQSSTGQYYVFDRRAHLPIAQPVLGERELVYVTECILSGWISSTGRFVTEFEKRCYGMSEAGIRREYMESLTARLSGLEMVVMGILSDAQELLTFSFGDGRSVVQSRKLMNIAKYILSTMMEDRLLAENSRKINAIHDRTA